MHEENKYQKIEILKQRKHNKISESKLRYICTSFGFLRSCSSQERERERDTKNRDGIGQKVRGSLAWQREGERLWLVLRDNYI